MSVMKLKRSERIQLIDNLKEIEKRIRLFEEQHKAINQISFHHGTIRINAETSHGDTIGHNYAIDFNKELLSYYIREEIDRLEEKSNKILQELTEDNKIKANL